MSLRHIGDACAQTFQDGKSKYVRVGSAFVGEEGRIVIKIDALPLPQVDWNGWINVFERKSVDTSEPQ